MNYKFWVYVNGSPVRLTLKPGQTVHHSSGGPDSEGWFRESVIYKHAGSGVYFESFVEGRDCDGYSSRWSDGFCPGEGLTSGAAMDGVVYPRWDDVTMECRDEYAEAAGY